MFVMLSPDPHRQHKVNYRPMDVMFTQDPGFVSEADLAGFHADWRRRPSPARLRRMLLGSEAVELAWCDGRLVGYASVLGDGEVFAYFASLEVLPDSRGRGIGSELVRRILRRYEGRYALDLVCDDELAPFYERLGWQKVTGMVRRNFDAPTD